MASRSRDGDRQLAPWIEIPKQHFRDSRSRFLPQIPALENDRHVLAHVVNRKRASVEQKDYDRFAGGHHRLDQFFLSADEIQTGAVAHVHERPRLARGLLVATDGEHDHVRLLRDVDGLGNLLAVLIGISGDDFVLIP